jgi:hypothetical protein
LTARAARLAAALLASAASACAPAAVTRFAFVAADDVLPVQVVAHRVKRVACREGWATPQPGHDSAVALAFEDVRETNVMTNVLLVTELPCVAVVGDVGRVVSAQAATRRESAPGRLAAVSLAEVSVPHSVVSPEAEGRACGLFLPWLLPSEALQDALAPHPPADALMLATFSWGWWCTRVRGVAVDVQ